MNGDDADEVVREAERAVYRTQWRIWEELALEQLAATAGLGRAPLVPGSEVIQLITWDGEHIGHVRRDTTQPAGECWVAVTLRQARPCGRVRQRSGRRPRRRPRLRQGSRAAAVTRHYLIGELSVRLEQLQAVTRPAAAREVADLRYQVETGPVLWLAAGLARALALADQACWDSLDRGDAAAFARQAAVGADLRLFGECARLTGSG